MVKRKLQPQQKTISAEFKKLQRKCETEGKSERTIEQYIEAVRRFTNLVGDIYVTQIDTEDIENFTWRLKENLAPSSVNYYLRGLRAFINFSKAKVQVPLVKENKKQITPFTEEQVRKLLKQPNRNTFVGMRDFVILNLLFDTGMRISEICGICKKNILPQHVIAVGKGGKERVVPIGSYCENLLNNYLENVEDIPTDKPIFLTENNLPMNRHRMNDRIKLYAQRVNIENVRASCHTFRHTFARTYLINGGDIYSLRKILGHETLDMVKQYVELFTEDVIEIHKKYSPSDYLFKKRRKKK